jgi:uncharacterized membrane protein (UPF0127 family)
MIVGIFMFVQDRFDIFDISWKEEIANEITKEKTQESDGSEEVIIKGENYVEINISNGLIVRVDVDIADTDIKRSMGLSGRRSLGDYEGMLFIYENEVNNPFWMKDMLIPLDIIFIDREGYIVDIKEDQQPCIENYCPSIPAKERFQYVLEVNAGFCKGNSIEEGNRMVQYLQ